jgi:hypothetical protein
MNDVIVQGDVKTRSRLNDKSGSGAAVVQWRINVLA